MLECRYDRRWGREYTALVKNLSEIYDKHLYYHLHLRHRRLVLVARSRGRERSLRVRG